MIAGFVQQKQQQDALEQQRKQHAMLLQAMHPPAPTPPANTCRHPQARAHIDNRCTAIIREVPNVPPVYAQPPPDPFMSRPPMTAAELERQMLAEVKQQQQHNQSTNGRHTQKHIWDCV
jgi:hypothetical protein